MLDVIKTGKTTFTAGSITVFIAIANAVAVRRGALGTLTKIASGDAPIAPATVEAFQVDVDFDDVRR